MQWASTRALEDLEQTACMGNTNTHGYKAAIPRVTSLNSAAYCRSVATSFLDTTHMQGKLRACCILNQVLQMCMSLHHMSKTCFLSLRFYL